MTRAMRHALGGLVAFLLAAGCTEEADEVRMTEVPAPPGGIVETVTTINSKQGTEVLAPTRRALYVREPDADRWRQRAVDWPDSLQRTEASPLAGMFWSRESYNFPTDHRLTSFAGRLWMLTRPAPSKPSTLLVSADGGRTWSQIDLPPPYRDAESNGSGGHDESQLSRIDPRAPLRIAARHEAGLFLIGPQDVWRASFAEGRLDSWERLAISHSEILGSATATPLPKVVRNYMPATEKRPFELLTVFGDRLYVYRRHASSDKWVLVSTLPTIDLELRAGPDGRLLYLLGPEAIYRSSERGERWEKITLAAPLDTAPQQRAFAFLNDADAFELEGDAPGLIVGTDRGALHRSLDGGDSWERVRDPDPDGRAITGLSVEEASGWIWASTRGLGLLRSTDGGESWETATRGLRASRPAAMATGPNDELLVGTRSGLFRLTGAPEDGHWDRYHERATTALELLTDSSRIFAGTLGGAIVTETSSGDLQVSEAGTFDGQAAPLFQPWTAPPWVSRSSAILDLAPRPDSEQIFAWSRGEGMLESTDTGDSWRRKELNPALRSALDRSIVTDAAVDREAGLYLVSQPFELNAPAQLWRSRNDGESWHAVYNFGGSQTHQPLFIRRPPDAPAETLYMARGAQLARSTDGGSTWRDLPGPWQEGSIRAYTPGRDFQTVLYNTRHSSHVAFVRKTAEREPEVDTYTLIWPDTGARPRSNLRDVLAIDGTVYVRTDDAVYAGSEPEGDAQLPHAPTIMATLVVILLMTGLSFFYLRMATVD